MSDNLSKDACEREISAYLDLPAEVFTDIFKLLPRRTLIQRIQPVNKAFKAICDRNVKSVHVIEWAEVFFRKLKAGKANQQVEDLAGHNCALAGQFVIDQTYFAIPIKNNESQAIQSVLRHSLDLLQQCKIQTESTQLLSAEHLACLTTLEPTKPVYMCVWITEGVTDANMSTLLRHPTILNCSRLMFVGWVAQDNRQTIFNWLLGWFWPQYNRQPQPIFDWLHHNPMDMDSNSSCIVDVVDQQQQQKQPDIRCLMLSFSQQKEAIERVLERCVQNLQQGRVPSDRRHFLLAFECSDELNELDRFARTENPSTGEVLLLEHVDDERHCYRLLRCLASQLADGTEQLYAKLFKTYCEFNIGDEQGKEPLRVYIEDY